MLLIVIAVILILALGGGGWGYSRGYGPAALSPLGVVLLILVVLYLAGVLRI